MKEQSEKDPSSKVKKLRKSLTLAAMNPARAVSTQKKRLKSDSVREDRQPLTCPTIKRFAIPPVGERKEWDVEELIANGGAVFVSPKHKYWCRYCGRVLRNNQDASIVDHLLRCTKVPDMVNVTVTEISQ